MVDGVGGDACVAHLHATAYVARRFIVGARALNGRRDVGSVLGGVSVSGHVSCFFFSSRRRHTRFDCDWSSDVCSSDLNVTAALHWGHALNNTLQDVLVRMKRMDGFNTPWLPGTDHASIAVHVILERRSEERRVGKECRSRWSPYH